MNRNQKIVVAIGLICAVLSGIFPPYAGEAIINGSNLSRHLGHHFLFSPPTPEQVSWSIIGEDALPQEGMALTRFRAKIVFPEFLVYLSLIIVITSGACLLLANRKV